MSCKCKNPYSLSCDCEDPYGLKQGVGSLKNQNISNYNNINRKRLVLSEGVDAQFWYDLTSVAAPLYKYIKDPLGDGDNYYNGYENKFFSITNDNDSSQSATFTMPSNSLISFYTRWKSGVTPDSIAFWCHGGKFSIALNNGTFSNGSTEITISETTATIESLGDVNGYDWYKLEFQSTIQESTVAGRFILVGEGDLDIFHSRIIF